MPEPKRKSLIEVTEPHYELAEQIRRKIAAYKGEHGLPTMLDALADMIGVHPRQGSKRKSA